MIPLATLTTWLEGRLAARSISTPVKANWLPDTPDEVVVVTAAGGSTVTMDGAIETSHVHVRCRGPRTAGGDAAAEALAKAVHGCLSPLTLNGTVQMGSTHVLSVMPMAPPTFLGRDVSQRSTYIATYLIDAPSPT